MIEADQLGTLIAGRYRLTEIAGSGGFSVVYRAEQVGLSRMVAVKLMRRDRVEIDPDLFRREAQIASRINHPNAVSIFDYGVTDDGLPFLVMEWLRGRTLADVIADSPLSLERIATIMGQVLRALDEAHGCGVVHRDLKCENVLIEQLRAGEDFAKVIDFGVARVLGVDSANLGVVGTPEYMAPEQIRNLEVGPYTDIYAIGIMLYELVVGRTPFAGGGIAEVLSRHLDDVVTPPHQLVPRCPLALSELIVRTLSKNPTDRPASAEGLHRMLGSALKHSATRACPQCGMTLNDTGRFCSTCGWHLTVTRGTQMGIVAPAVRARLLPPKRPDEAGFADTLGGLENIDLPTRVADRAPAAERDVELVEILSFVQAAHPGPALAIVGPRGSGKSRLLRRAIEHVSSERVALLVGRDPSGLQESWYPILAVLAAALNLASSPTHAELSKAVAGVGLPERDVPGLCEMFDTPGPLRSAEIAVRQREAFAAARRVIEAIDVRFPGAIVCLFDIDQYDKPSLRLIEALCQSLDGTGLRLLMTTEDAAYVPPGALTVMLEPLQADAVTSIAATTAGRALTIEEQLLVGTYAKGIPAHGVQLGRWAHAGGLWESCPESYIELLALRVNHLGPIERKTLQAIALMGTRADLESLNKLVGVEVAPIIESLSRAGFAVFAENEAEISLDVAGIVFESMPAEARRDMHSLAHTLQLSTVRRAHHAMGAAAFDTAHALYMAAGDSAVRRFDDHGATRCYGRAVQAARHLLLVGDIENGTTWFVTASVCLADTQRFTGEYAMAHSALAEAAEVDWDGSRAGIIARSRARVLAASGDLKAARTHYAACIRLALRSGERNFLCESYVDLAGVLARLGDFKQAAAELAEAVDVVTLGEDIGTIDGIDKLWLLGFRLAEIQLRAGDPAQAERGALKALAQARRCQAHQAPGRCLALLARIAEESGSPRKALSYRTQAIEELRKVGDRRSTAKLLLENARVTLQASPLSSDGGAARERAQRVEGLAFDLAREITGTTHTSFTPLMALRPVRPRLEDDAD